MLTLLKYCYSLALIYFSNIIITLIKPIYTEYWYPIDIRKFHDTEQNLEPWGIMKAMNDVYYKLLYQTKILFNYAKILHI